MAVIDFSHADCGYIMAEYTGAVSRIKLRITCPDSIQYTYDLHGNGYETFPLSSGDGEYEITVYENISGTSYSTCLYTTISVSLQDEFGPFLYPNQYVNFTAESKTVQKGAGAGKGTPPPIWMLFQLFMTISPSPLLTIMTKRPPLPPAILRMWMRFWPPAPASV